MTGRRDHSLQGLSSAEFGDNRNFNFQKQMVLADEKVQVTSTGMSA